MPAARQNGGAVQYTQRGLRPLPPARSSVRRLAVRSSHARGYRSWSHWEERAGIWEPGCCEGWDLLWPRTTEHSTAPNCSSFSLHRVLASVMSNGV